MRFIRLTLIFLLLGVLVVAIPPALEARGIQISIPSKPNFFGPDLDSVAEEIPLLSTPTATAVPTPRTFREVSRTDLTSFAQSHDYSPDPTQGTLHRTDTGIAWWGAGPSDGALRPVVVLLHGAGRNGRSMIDMWHEVAMKEGLVLIALDFDKVPGWNTGVPDPRAVLTALDHATTLYRADPDRVVMFGHSRGAIAAQIWVNRYAGPWKALAVHAGTLEAQHVIPVQAGVPVRHYLGSVDGTFPFGPARDSGAAMAKAGHPFELIRLEGHNHWFYERGEDIAADAWAWLAQQID